ncbi:hypothetical protein TMEN_7647 [Trichophyton mentagrophytes]|nr:hypothetical protein TMEN_7647 [Trichophyton mentagrophytes]
MARLLGIPEHVRWYIEMCLGPIGSGEPSEPKASINVSPSGDTLIIRVQTPSLHARDGGIDPFRCQFF